MGNSVAYFHPNLMSMWHLEWLMFVIIAGIIYFFIAGPLTKKIAMTETGLPFWKQFAFYAGLTAVFMAYGTPIADLGHHYLFSAHMLSMGLIYLVMPPLLIIGLPDWLYKKVFKHSAIRNFIARMTHPIIAIMLFNIFFSMYHVPAIFNFMSNHMAMHLGYHYVLILFSLFMWWPIVCPVADMDRLSELQKMGYIFANGVLLTPACALIIFSEIPMYALYEHAPRVFDAFTVVVDQQFGGIEMKIMQEIVYGCALGYVFVHWMKNQKRQDQQEALQGIKGYSYLEIKHDSNPQ